MCGIIGYVGDRRASEIILDGLRRVEYRGYDSAGIAVLNGSGLEIRRRVGKVADLAALMGAQPVDGTVGLGHTRWATHGRPSDENAHPHLDCSGSIAVVHNGILENYVELKTRLAASGHRFQSETDTEVLAHLVEEHWTGATGDLVTAVRAALREVPGAYAVAVLVLDAVALGRIPAGGPRRVRDVVQRSARRAVPRRAPGRALGRGRPRLRVSLPGSGLVLDAETLVVTLSQSGETADTLGAARAARERGALVLAITNVVGSALAREATGVLYTHRSGSPRDPRAPGARSRRPPDPDAQRDSAPALRLSPGDASGPRRRSARKSRQVGHCRVGSVLRRRTSAARGPAGTCRRLRTQSSCRRPPDPAPLGRR
jgi:Glutamine amidotransferase domain/SIS domain